VFGLVRLLGLAASAAILVWAVHFRGGMALSSEKDKLLIFNVIEKQRSLTSILLHISFRTAELRVDLAVA
jgi:hypothetical protein